MTITINVPAGYLATAVVADKPYQVDPAKMTDAALLHVFEYGFQRIVNDKTGGKDKDAAAKDTAARAMIDRLVAADYKRRKVGAGAVDPIVRYVRDVLRQLLSLPAFATRKTEYKAYSEAADRELFLDDWFATMPEGLAAKVETAAQKKLDADRKARDSIAAFVDEVATEAGSELLTPATVETAAKKASKKK